MVFKIGDKVVCIDDKITKDVTIGDSGMIKEGDPYTIKKSTIINGKDVVHLHEIYGGTGLHSGFECYWMAYRFRKVKKQRFTNKLTEKLAKLAQEKQHDLIQLPKKKQHVHG